MREAAMALTRTKMSVLESPTLYFPSETLTMGNCEGQEQQPRISRTCSTQGRVSGAWASCYRGGGAQNSPVGPVGHRPPLQSWWGTDPPL